MVSWNSREFMKNDYLLFLGIAYFFTGTIDSIHMISYKGMGVFTKYDANLPTQLWISSRYIESLSLLSATLFLKRKLNVSFLLLLYTLILGSVLFSIFYLDIFPVCFVEGQGLTRFKIYSEYIISTILAISLFLLHINKDQFEPYVHRLISLSIVFTIISELSFTFFIKTYGLSNLIGHYFKVFSFYMIYRAVIKTILTNPFDILFRNLVENEKALESMVDKRGIEIDKYSSILEEEVKKRRLIWQKLNDSKHMLQSIFNSITEPMVLMDSDSVVTYINEYAVKYYNLSNKDDALGKKCKQGLCQAKMNCKDCEIPGLLNENRKHSFSRTSPFNKDRLERVTIFPVISTNSEVESYLLRITDITEKSILEKKLIQSEKLASIGTLVSGIAHEINNPNSFVTFNIPILRDYLSDIIPIVDEYAKENPDFELFYMPYKEFREDLFKLLDNVEHGSKRINSIVSDLKDFSRTNGDVIVNEIDIKKLVKKVEIFCRSKIKRTVKTFNIDLPDDLPLVSLNPHALEQVLINLLINASQAFNGLPSNDSRVDLIIKPEETDAKNLIIEVHDNASGIDEKTLKNLFDPFFTTKPSDSGTGLGLYISHNLVESMGGFFEVESEVGMGSIFRIVLNKIYS
jgi:signal transduction histidine kinase